MKSHHKTRKVHEFPNIISVERQPCLGGFFEPSLTQIEADLEKLQDYFKSSTVGLILPLASERETQTFTKTLNYAIQCGIEPERIIIVYSPKAQFIIDNLKVLAKNCILLNESEIRNLLNVEKIHSLFGVNLAEQRGKGRAITLAFIFLKYVCSWDDLQDLFILDVDTNITEYQPLHYLGYIQAAFPDQHRLFLLTAQNNVLRDNHYLFIMRDSWKSENHLGHLYAQHLNQLVWSLSGEIVIRWGTLSEKAPFSVGYGLETIWQLFAAEQLEYSSKTDTPYKVAQVVNPQTKIDGGFIGQNGRCYDAVMYRQINFLTWSVIKYGKPLGYFTVSDYQKLNANLKQVRETTVLPDNEDHGPPYRVTLTSDLLIPPIAMLASQGCLYV